MVEELQYLRELLIRNLAPILAAMRARQGMAIMLRLNRVLDHGVAVAVVGYTDALVATLFAQNGVPLSGAEQDPDEIDRQLAALEAELAAVTRPRSPRWISRPSSRRCRGSRRSPHSSAWPATAPSSPSPARSPRPAPQRHHPCPQRIEHPCHGGRLAPRQHL